MSLETATHTATRRTVVAGNTTPFTKEMCHEEIPHRDRVDLAAYRPGDRECQRGARFAVEPRFRRQRLLTSSRAREHLCSRAQHDALRRPSGTREVAAFQREDAPMNETYRVVVPAIGFVQVWLSPAQTRFER
jgi:hypothetical protein